MKNERRLFLNQVSFMAGLAVLNKPLTSIASVSKRIYTLHSAGQTVTIYHTNDMHGKIDAVYDGLGGIGNISLLIEKQETSGLLFDAGDFIDSSQGLVQHQRMIRAMNNTGYHAATPGNQELANGQAYLAVLIPHMRFTMVNCNYRFEEPLRDLVKPYLIINSGKFKIGVTGVGHKIDGVVYNDAIACANKMAAMLKEKEKCDLVICLSHLGYQQAAGNIPDNQKLAKSSEHIDMIIGGHNRKLLSGPIIMRNKLKNEIILSQTAWDGLMMGSTIFDFEDGEQKRGIKAKYFIPGKPAGESFALSYAKLKEKAA